MPKQLAFDLDARPSLGREDFLIAPPNAAAVKWIDAWPAWPAPTLVLFGPAGSGKTHLTRVFMAASGAEEITGGIGTRDAARAYVIENADAVAGDAAAEEALFHFYNDLKNGGGSALLTATRPVAQWRIELPDLASRLRAAPAAEIEAPDDTLLGALLVKMFADRQVRIDADVVAYAMPRMERSFQAARDLVRAADKLALERKRPITVPLIREVLGG